MFRIYKLDTRNGFGRAWLRQAGSGIIGIALLTGLGNFASALPLSGGIWGCEVGCISQSTVNKAEISVIPLVYEIPLVFPVTMGFGGLLLGLFGIWYTLSYVNSHRSWVGAFAAIFIGLGCSIGGGVWALVILFPV